MYHLTKIIFILILVSSPVFCETFEFSSDSFSTVMARGREYTVLSGNAQIISDSTVIKSGKIELYGDEYKYAQCSGRVEMEDNEKGLRIAADSMLFNRKDDITRFEGGIVLEDLKNEVIVKGSYMEYSGDTETVIIQVGVRIFKDDMVSRSEFARYIRDDDILELSGLPLVFWKGDEYKALKITINLDTDEIFLEGSVSGTIYTENDEEQTDEKDSSGTEKSEGDESAPAETEIQEQDPVSENTSVNPAAGSPEANPDSE